MVRESPVGPLGRPPSQAPSGDYSRLKGERKLGGRGVVFCSPGVYAWDAGGRGRRFL